MQPTHTTHADTHKFRSFCHLSVYPTNWHVCGRFFIIFWAFFLSAADSPLYTGQSYQSCIFEFRFWLPPHIKWMQSIVSRYSKAIHGKYHTYPFALAGISISTPVSGYFSTGLWWWWWWRSRAQCEGANVSQSFFSLCQSRNVNIVDNSIRLRNPLGAHQWWQIKTHAICIYINVRRFKWQLGIWNARRAFIDCKRLLGSA